MQLVAIQQKIFEIRDQKVMLDFDLALLYEVETRVLNQAVKRNIDRFPEDFMFKFTKKEWSLLRSQFVISSAQLNENQSSSSSQFVMMENLPNNRTGKYLPYAFTEHGITMLASVLRSDTAIRMNIAIVRAFISLRKFAVQYGEILGQLNELKDRVGNHDEQLNQIYDAIENLLDEKSEQKKWGEREKIGFKS